MEIRRHADQLTLSGGQLLDDRAGKLIRDVNKGNLHRLQSLVALIEVVDDLCLRNRELKALAAHVLDEDREVQLTATAHLEAVRREFLDAKRDIGVQLAEQTLAPGDGR